VVAVEPVVGFEVSGFWPVAAGVPPGFVGLPGVGRFTVAPEVGCVTVADDAPGVGRCAVGLGPTGVSGGLPPPVAGWVTTGFDPPGVGRFTVAPGGGVTTPGITSGDGRFTVGRFTVAPPGGGVTTPGITPDVGREIAPPGVGRFTVAPVDGCVTTPGDAPGVGRETVPPGVGRFTVAPVDGCVTTPGDTPGVGRATVGPGVGREIAAFGADGMPTGRLGGIATGRGADGMGIGRDIGRGAIAGGRDIPAGRPAAGLPLPCAKTGAASKRAPPTVATKYRPNMIAFLPAPGDRKRGDHGVHQRAEENSGLRKCPEWTPEFSLNSDSETELARAALYQRSHLKSLRNFPTSRSIDESSLVFSSVKSREFANLGSQRHRSRPRGRSS